MGSRIQDITEPLIAIVDLAGGEWPQRVRGDLVKLCSQEEDADIGCQLLADIKIVFDKSGGANKLPTIALLNALVGIEDDRPWAAFWLDDLKHDKSQKPAQRLATLLARYDIKPRTIKLTNGKTVKGYHRSDFLEAWKRHLPEPRREIAVTPVTAVTHERKVGDGIGEGYGNLAVTEQGVVTELPPKVTAVTAVTAFPQGNDDDYGFDL